MSLPFPDDGTRLLFSPETGLNIPSSGVEAATLAPTLNGVLRSLANPEILIYRDTAEAAFVSAAWHDAAGKLLYQRDVVIVKPDYGVVVDYLLETGRVTVARNFFHAGPTLATDAHGAQGPLPDGRTWRVQAIDAPGAGITPTAREGRIIFSSTREAPAPVPTVFFAWSGIAAPTVRFVQPKNPMIVKFDVAFPDGRQDNVAVAWEKRPLHIGGKEFVGWAAVYRTDAQGKVSEIEIN